MANVQKKSNKVTLAGFENAPTSLPKGIVIVSTGDWDTGKTELALTAPAPLAFIDMDTGVRGVIEKWAKKKEIIYRKFNYKDSTKLEEWNRMWGEAKEAFISALEHKDIRSVVWDTATEAYELVKMARWGKINKVIMDGGTAVPYPYGPVNEEFRDLLRKALHTNKVVILVHRTQDEYIDKKATGERIRSGYKDMDFVTEVGLRTWKRVTKGDEGVTSTYGFTVTKCRLNRDIFGMDFEEPMSTIPFLASQIFPETNIEDWE